MQVPEYHKFDVEVFCVVWLIALKASKRFDLINLLSLISL